MPKNRKAAALTAEEMKAVEAAASDYKGEYVLHSGDSYRGRKASARNLSIQTVTERKPIQLATFLDRVANIEGKGKGFPPSFALSALALHSGAKPAVLIRCYKDDKGNYRASTTVTTPGEGFGTEMKMIEEDAIVLPAPKAKGSSKEVATK